LNELFQTYGPIAFPVFFVGLWLVVTTILGALSGWYALMRRYPDRAETPLLTLRYQSGSMGLMVSYGGLLTLSACPSGLRVGMNRLFGPFWRNFFVPWTEIRIIRRRMILLWLAAQLAVGDPVAGTLSISADVADRLARAAQGSWPEAGPYPRPRPGTAFVTLLAQWAAVTTLAALFFTLAPRLMAPRGATAPPVAVGILFPAIVFGVVFLVKFIRQVRN
jgi:hypothetical protein